MAKMAKPAYEESPDKAQKIEEIMLPTIEDATDRLRFANLHRCDRRIHLSSVPYSHRQISFKEV